MTGSTAGAPGNGGRRLGGHGLEVAREVEVGEGRGRGWIDLLAFNRRTGTLFVVEVMTALDDLGRLERQVGWYERLAPNLAASRDWTVTRTVSWVLLLATADADAAIARQRDALQVAFPVRAGAMMAGLRTSDVPSDRGLALIDPRRKRRDWLIPTRSDGRRSPAPFADLGAARRALADRGRPR